MVINSLNINAGHDAQGKGASGACAKLKDYGWFYESVEDRIVKDDLLDLCKQNNITYHDTTVDAAGTQGANLSQIVKKCNANKVDLNVFIHFNSGREDYTGDGRNAGVEVYGYDNGTKEIGERICKNISNLGFTNRGFKTSNYYVLRHTVDPAIIVEVCFVDDKDDVLLYNKIGHRIISKAILEGILGRTVNDNNNSDIKQKEEIVYDIVTGGFGSKENAEEHMKSLQKITNWYMYVRKINENDHCLVIGGFTGLAKVERKMNALKEITGWWLTYEEQK